ncbi:MAG TPA: SDR family NAD(P)-dependent oxidoreductase [Candidatus Angelobacter sp.]|nr:SDR family NAD(P)-dependent oxidoreductase [Candidatus Angelobacter sp.]
MTRKASQPRLAVITGGGQGIGLAAARGFAHAGFSVVIAGRNESRLQAAAAELQRDKAQVVVQRCDVTDPVSVEKLFAWVREQHAAIDVLFNNAGVAHAGASVDKLAIADWTRVIDTNLTGVFLVTRSALPLMRAGATIVNNLSVAATHSFPGMSAYNASKAGALGFTNVLREELRKRGIRVLALLPGAVDTEIWNQFWPDAPKEKMLSPQTVAEAVLHAVSAPAEATIEEIRIGPTSGIL